MSRTYFDASDRGCIFDGAHGQVYNDNRVLALAEKHGWELQADGRAAWAAYVAEEDTFTSGAETVQTADWFGHSADLVSVALDYLNTYACDGVTLEWRDGDLMCVGREMMEWEAEEAFDEMINECYPIVSLGGLDYDHARAWKCTDPIAYRCGMLDWADSEGIEIL